MDFNKLVKEIEEGIDDNWGPDRDSRIDGVGLPRQDDALRDIQDREIEIGDIVKL